MSSCHEHFCLNVAEVHEYYSSVAYELCTVSLERYLMDWHDIAMIMQEIVHLINHTHNLR
jgi:hypothetical protein